MYWNDDEIQIEQIIKSFRNWIKFKTLGVIYNKAEKLIQLLISEKAKLFVKNNISLMGELLQRKLDKRGSKCN